MYKHYTNNIKDLFNVLTSIIDNKQKSKQHKIFFRTYDNNTYKLKSIEYHMNTLMLRFNKEYNSHLYLLQRIDKDDLNSVFNLISSAIRIPIIDNKDFSVTKISRNMLDDHKILLELDDNYNKFTAFRSIIENNKNSPIILKSEPDYNNIEYMYIDSTTKQVNICRIVFLADPSSEDWLLYIDTIDITPDYAIYNHNIDDDMLYNTLKNIVGVNMYDRL